MVATVGGGRGASAAFEGSGTGDPEVSGHADLLDLHGDLRSDDPDAGDRGEPRQRLRGRRNGHGRQWETRYVGLLFVADALVGLGAADLAFRARFGLADTPYARGYVILSMLLPFAFVAALAANGAYERRYLFVGTAEYERVIRAGFALTAVAAITSYALNVNLSRGYMLVALPMATLTCLVVRFLLRRQLHKARTRGACLRRVLVVGHAHAVVQITGQLRRERFHGLDVVAGCLPHVTDGIEPLRAINLPIAGSFADVAGAVAACRADMILVLSCPEIDGHALRRLAWQVQGDDVDLIVASSLIDVAGARTTIRPVDGLPMMHIEHPTLTGGRRLVKTVVDRVGAVVLLTLCLPVLAVTALAIRLESSGPVLFRQTRVGKEGKAFTMVKFRSMFVEAPALLEVIRHQNDCDGVLFKMRVDPRVTRVGRVIRRLSLDELPQLFNVVSGHMSLVGPRPPLPDEVARYPKDLRRRLAVKPGMTGLWQVSGRSDLSWAEAVRLDLRYVENWTLSLDLVIMLRTLIAVVRRSGAY
jgi:exopolysaccharide biosynthesis polyprenyl glycosylphosphotransferase